MKRISADDGQTVSRNSFSCLRHSCSEESSGGYGAQLLPRQYAILDCPEQSHTSPSMTSRMTTDPSGTPETDTVRSKGPPASSGGKVSRNSPLPEDLAYPSCPAISALTKRSGTVSPHTVIGLFLCNTAPSEKSDPSFIIGSPFRNRRHPGSFCPTTSLPPGSPADTATPTAKADTTAHRK